MKTKEISFDDLQNIKANNYILEKLCEIEKIMDELYYNKMGLDVDFYNDKDDSELNYWHSFEHCIMMHQTELMKNSKEIIEK